MAFLNELPTVFMDFCGWFNRLIPFKPLLTTGFWLAKSLAEFTGNKSVGLTDGWLTTGGCVDPLTGAYTFGWEFPTGRDVEVFSDEVVFLAEF